MKKIIWIGVLVCVLIAFLVLALVKAPFNHQVTDTEFIQLIDSLDSVSIQEPDPVKLYGIPVDSFEVIKNTIRPNQFLGEILSDYRITDQEIHELAIKSKKVFDVRKIGSRKKYTILTTKDSIPRAEFFIYEPNDIDSLSFEILSVRAPRRALYHFATMVGLGSFLCPRRFFLSVH